MMSNVSNAFTDQDPSKSSFNWHPQDQTIDLWDSNIWLWESNMFMHFGISLLSNHKKMVPKSQFCSSNLPMFRRIGPWSWRRSKRSAAANMATRVEQASSWPWEKWDAASLRGKMWEVKRFRMSFILQIWEYVGWIWYIAGSSMENGDLNGI